MLLYCGVAQMISTPNLLDLLDIRQKFVIFNVFFFLSLQNFIPNTVQTVQQNIQAIEYAINALIDTQRHATFSMRVLWQAIPSKV